MIYLKKTIIKARIRNWFIYKKLWSNITSYKALQTFQ